MPPATTTTQSVTLDAPRCNRPTSANVLITFQFLCLIQLRVQTYPGHPFESKAQIVKALYRTYIFPEHM